MRAGARRPERRRATRPFAMPNRRNRSRFAVVRAIARAAVLLAGIAIAIVLVVLAVRGLAALFHRSTAVPVQSEPTPLPFPAFSSTFVQDGVPWTHSSSQAVDAVFRPIVNQPDFPPTSSAIVLDARTGDVLYAHNARMALVPASTLKVIVAGTALADLGPDFRFATSLATDGQVAAGVVSGDLYLVGGGDPLLQSDQLRGAVHRLKALGVREIDGSIMADGSLYGPDQVNPTWDPNDLEYGWAAPPSALTMDGGSVQFTITPDASGGLARVIAEPAAAAGRIVGNVETVSSDADNTLRIDPLPDGSGYQVSGAIPYGAPQQYWRAIAHPTEIAAQVLRSLIVQAGIRVTGPATSGQTPSSATPLWSVQSAPLTSIIQQMAFNSDNHIAEQLLREVGAREFGQGTLVNGIKAEHAYLSTIGADQSGLRLIDGSGLSADDRVTATALAAVLRDLLKGRDAKSMTLLFPRVGLDGTVSARYDMPADVAGRVRGKDGYIGNGGGASGLAGYVITTHHGVAIYAFLADDWQQGLDPIWAGEDSALTSLARM